MANILGFPIASSKILFEHPNYYRYIKWFQRNKVGAPHGA